MSAHEHKYIHNDMHAMRMHTHTVGRGEERFILNKVTAERIKWQRNRTSKIPFLFHKVKQIQKESTCAIVHVDNPSTLVVIGHVEMGQSSETHRPATLT